MESWKKALVLAAGATGVAGVLYYLLREEPDSKLLPADSRDDKAKRKFQPEEELANVQQILREIVESHEKMRTHMKALTQELLAKKLDFEQTYQRVKDVQPEDPLERNGLNMAEFDTLLGKYQHDVQVKEDIGKIMGMPTNPSSEPAKASVPARKVIDVHSFMLEELEKLVQHVGIMPDKVSYDMKTVTLAAQAIVGAKVEEKFSLTSEDIERAVIEHHTSLATDQEFAAVNMKMQQAMAFLMGGPVRS